MNDAALVPDGLPDPVRVLEGRDWGLLEHAYGSAVDTPIMLAGLLDDDPQMRARALVHLHHAVHHQNTLYSATVPAAVYVASILGDPRAAMPVDKEPQDFPGPLRAELLGWLGSVAGEGSDEAAVIARHHGFVLEEYPPFADVREIRPLLYPAIAACFSDPDLHVREAALAACIPLLDDSRLRRHRAALVSLVREVLGVSALWQYRERAIDALTAWGEDATGLEGQQEAFAVCAPAGDDGIPGPGLGVTLGDTSEPPF